MSQTPGAEVTTVNYAYKILDVAPPSPLSSALPTTALDTQDGFVHLSQGAQVPITAGLFFSAHKELWVLRVGLQQAHGKVIWAPTPRCIHLYPKEERGAVPELGKENVLEVRRCGREEGQTWEEAFKALDSWLVDA